MASIPQEMNLWLEIFFAILSGAAGFGLGRLSSYLPKSWWLLGYFIPLALVLFYGVGMQLVPAVLVPVASCYRQLVAAGASDRRAGR